MKRILTLTILMCATFANAQQQQNPQLDSLCNEKDPVQLNKKLQKLGAGSESEMVLLTQYYGRDRRKTDSVNRLILSRFPKGNSAATAAQGKIFTEPAQKQEKMLSAFKTEFPTADDDQILYSIAYAYVNERNIPKAAYWAERIKRLEYKYGIVESLMAKDLNVAKQVVGKDVGKFSKGEKNGDYYKVLSTYGNILTKLENNDEAFPYLEEAYANSPRRDDVLVRNYAYLLGVKGNHQQALPIMEKLILEGKADEQLKKQLKASYLKANPEKDAAVYITGLQRSLKEKTQQEVAKLMISESAPAFTVKDANGKTVSLADFKGKIIVLDFWATWCGPCKKSFPAMQMAVNKYKNDPNVKFLFIHTWERMEDPLSDAKLYLKETNFSLDLYMDIKDPVTKINPAVSLFKVRGIPAKFVIDGQGQLRFKLTGFMGGDEAAVEELSAMIELSRKPKA